MKTLPSLTNSTLLLGVWLLLISTFSVCAAPPANNLKEGIEAVGGTTFIIEVQPNKDAATGEIIPLTPAAVDTAKNTLMKRLKESGTLNALASVQGNRIEIQLPKIDAADVKPIKKLLTTTAKLTIHKAHPQTAQLADLVASGEETVPGYRAYPQIVKDANGAESVRQVLVSRRPAITGKEIAKAWPDRSSNTMVFIELTPAGAKNMETFTRSLRAGRDQIVSVLDGKAINVATLNSGVEALGKQFLISGLGDLEECESLAKRLSNPMENDIKVIDQRTISARISQKGR